MSNLSNDLLEKAIELEICEKAKDKWSEPTNIDLVNIGKEHIDFCILNDFPTNEYLIANLKKECEANNVFVEGRFDLQGIAQGRVIVQGSSTGRIIVDDFAAVQIYARHNSKASVIVGGYARVYIWMYDDCELKIISSDNSKVYVYKYSGNIAHVGNVRIRERSNEAYRAKK